MGRLARLKPLVAELPARGLATVSPNSWRNDKTTAERGYGGAWQRARIAWLHKHPLCAYCQRDRRVTRVTPAEVVDHKTPHEGDKTLFWDSNNWQSLCRPCHDRIKKREEARLK